MNSMRTIRIEKLTLNIGAGTNQDTLKKGISLIKQITGKTPVKTVATKRIPGWGLRPGLPIGCKLTLRKKEAEDLLNRLLEAKEHKLTDSSFDSSGNVSFGLSEYLDIPGMKYDPKIGAMGFEVSVTLERRGYRLKRRKVNPKKISRKHLITKEEAQEYFKNTFNTIIEEK